MTKKAQAILEKISFDIATKEGITWTNRTAPQVSSFVNYMDKKHGKGTKYRYYGSQDPSKKGTKEHMSGVRLTSDDIMKQIKSWDPSKGSFGNIYR